MKTNIKGLIAGFSLLAVLCACEKEKATTYGPKDCVYFYHDGTSADTAKFAFAMLANSDVESAVFSTEVRLFGVAVDYDRKFDMEVVHGARNPQTKFEIIRPALVKAGETTGYAEIRVWKTANLDTKRDTVTIGLVPTGDLLANFVEHSTRTITFYNGIDRPKWWTVSYESYMGRFHEKKMEILKIVLGSMDDPRTDVYRWAYSQMLLNEYCELHDIKYPGTENPMRFANGY